MPTDILLDSDGDLLTENGDLVIGDSTVQHQQLLLSTNEGEWKLSPKSGMGIINYLNDERLNDMMNEINYQYTNDGMKVNSTNMISGKLYIDAAYE